MTNRILFYFNDQLADVSPETVFAYTLQAYNIGDLKIRNSSYTYQLKFPDTPTNRIIFGYSNDVNSANDVPYSRIDTRVVSNGVELISGGSGFVVSYDGVFNVQIYSATTDLFSIIETKLMSEIDLGIYSQLDDDFIYTNRDSLTDISTPVVDYGKYIPFDAKIINSNFLETLDPWTKEDYLGGGNDWEFLEPSDSNYPGVRGEASTTTNLLTQAYKFYNGSSYRIVVKVRYDPVYGPGSFSMAVLLSDNAGATQTVDTPSGSLTLGDSFTVTDLVVTADADYPYIQLILLTGGLILSSVEATLRITDINIRAPFYLPMISYKSTITKLIEDAGFTLSITLRDSHQDYFNRQFLPFSRNTYTYPSKFIDSKLFNASPSGSQTFSVTNATKTLITFTRVNSNGSDAWYDENGTYTFHNTTYNLSCRFIVSINVTVGMTGSNTAVFYLMQGSTVLESYSVTSAGTYTIYLESSDLLLGGASDAITVKANLTSGSSASIQIRSGNFYNIISNIPQGVLNFSVLCLPDISQKTFLADFIYRYGLILYEKSGVITMKPLQYIIDNKVSVNWTNKRVLDKEDTISFQSNIYAQSNLFKDLDSENLIPGSFSSLDLTNVLLDLEKTFYTSIVTATESRDITGINVCVVPIWEFTSPSKYELIDGLEDSIRILYLRNPIESDPVIKYAGSTETDYLVAVYYDPFSGIDATWEYVLSQFYLAIKENFTNIKIVSRKYFLNDKDISDINFNNVIYDSGAYFLINKINNYNPGRVTKCDLFKII